MYAALTSSERSVDGEIAVTVVLVLNSCAQVGNLNRDIDRLTEANHRLQQELVRDRGVQVGQGFVAARVICRAS